MDKDKVCIIAIFYEMCIILNIKILKNVSYRARNINKNVLNLDRKHQVNLKRAI